MDRLKAETRPAHDATEGIPFSAAMVERRLPKDRYVGQLVAYAIVHRALDEALAGSDHLMVRAVWSDDLAKTPLLQRDLTFFAAEINGVPPAAIEAAERFAEVIGARAQHDPVFLLGYLYVLEGSTLGATILRQHIAAAYGLTNDDGLAYYSPYGNAVMPHWKQFKERMNAAAADPADHDRIIEGASDAFRRVGEILRALSADLD
jgi:heme oxygenase